LLNKLEAVAVAAAALGLLHSDVTSTIYTHIRHVMKNNKTTKKAQKTCTMCA